MELINSTCPTDETIKHLQNPIYGTTTEHRAELQTGQTNKVGPTYELIEGSNHPQESSHKGGRNEINRARMPKGKPSSL